MNDQEILQGLQQAILDYNGDRVVEFTRQGLNQGIPPTTLIFDGLSVGMHLCGDLYERHERFVIDMLKCSKAMERGLAILVPLLKSGSTEAKNQGTIVLGLVRGNTQDIGKNLVSLMLTAAGFQVNDLGKNVRPEVFVDTAVQTNAQVIGMSIMTNSSLAYCEQTVDLLKQRGLRARFGVMIGGAGATAAAAERLGISYGADANEAVSLARSFIAGINPGVRAPDWHQEPRALGKSAFATLD